jgi:hypothetical protein
MMFRWFCLYPTTSRKRVSLNQGDTILGDLHALLPTRVAQKLLGNPPSCLSWTSQSLFRRPARIPSGSPQSGMAPVAGSRRLRNGSKNVRIERISTGGSKRQGSLHQCLCSLYSHSPTQCKTLVKASEDRFVERVSDTHANRTVCPLQIARQLNHPAASQFTV